MENGIDTIVSIVAALLLLGLLLVPFLAFIAYVFLQNSKRKSIRKRALAQYGHVTGLNHSIPVRYASEPRFRAFFKIFPWEGAGLLVPANGVVTFVGE
jgi:hypothetical protein